MPAHSSGAARVQRHARRDAQHVVLVDDDARRVAAVGRRLPVLLEAVVGGDHAAARSTAPRRPCRPRTSRHESTKQPTPTASPTLNFDTARRPARRVPTISWPGTIGKIACPTRRGPGGCRSGRRRSRGCRSARRAAPGSRRSMREGRQRRACGLRRRRHALSSWKSPSEGSLSDADPHPGLRGDGPTRRAACRAGGRAGASPAGTMRSPRADPPHSHTPHPVPAA